MRPPQLVLAGAEQHVDAGEDRQRRPGLPASRRCVQRRELGRAGGAERERVVDALDVGGAPGCGSGRRAGRRPAAPCRRSGRGGRRHPIPRRCGRAARRSGLPRGAGRTPAARPGRTRPASPGRTPGRRRSPPQVRNPVVVAEDGPGPPGSRIGTVLHRPSLAVVGVRTRKSVPRQPPAATARWSTTVAGSRGTSFSWSTRVGEPTTVGQRVQGPAERGAARVPSRSCSGSRRWSTGWARCSSGPGTSSTWSAAASATPCSASSATISTSPPRPGPDEIEALLRSFSPTVWTIGKEFGTIGCRVTEGGHQLGDRGHHLPVRRLRSGQPQAGRGVRRHPRRRPGPARLHGERDGRGAAAAAFCDPYGGLADLAAGVLRTPAAPEISFSDDPLRMMRAARFAAQLGFTPAPEVVAAMTAMADRIEIVSAERVRDELAKLLLADRPARRAGSCWSLTGLADRVLPELPALRLERDEHHRHKDVFEHCLTVLEQAIDLERRGSATGPTWSSGWPRCCTTSASRRRGGSSPAARCRSTITTWSAPSWREPADRAALLRRRGRGRRDAGRAAPALPRLRRRAVDRLRRPPLRPRRRRPAASACTS